MLFWDGKSRLSDGRTGVVRDGTGDGSTSMGAEVRGGHAGGGELEGGGGGVALVGGGDGWLEGDKSVDDQATDSTKTASRQHPQQPPTAIPQPPIQ